MQICFFTTTAVAYLIFWWSLKPYNYTQNVILITVILLNKPVYSPFSDNTGNKIKKGVLAMSLQWCSWTHTCAAYLINAAMLHKVSWWKHGIKIINISNRSSCNYTSPWHSVSASQKNNSCGRLLRRRWCLIEELINETSRRPFNGDEFPWHRSEAPIVSLWNYETQMISFFFWVQEESCQLIDTELWAIGF